MDLGIGRGDSARRVDGQAADDAGPARGGDRTRSATWSRAAAVDQDGTDLRLTWTPRRQAAGLDRRLRAQGARAHRPHRRRRDPAARRPGPHPLVRGPAARATPSGRPRPERDQGDGRGAGARRRPGSTRDRVRWFPALVSNHVVDLVNRYDPQGAAACADRLRPRSRGLRLPPPRRGRLDNAEFVDDEVVDRFCVIGSVDDHIASCASSPTRASTSSTST